MTLPTQFHVFLSAVSSEFLQERVQLEDWLERKGLHVSSQENFNQGGSTLWQKLHDEVARCQAVICVMGIEPGWPSSGELPDGAPERSWTQWEFWLAWGEAPWSPSRRDKVFVFFPADLDQRMEKARTAASGDSNRLHALNLQQAHIDRVKATLSSTSKCNTSSPAGLWCCHANKILQTYECRSTGDVEPGPSPWPFVEDHGVGVEAGSQHRAPRIGPPRDERPALSGLPGHTLATRSRPSAAAPS